METFRCPTCLFVLTDPEQRRCPSCHKRLRRRGRPIVLGDKTKFGAHEPLHIDLVYAEHAEREKRNNTAEQVSASVATPAAPAEAKGADAKGADAPLVVSPPWVSPPVYETPPAPEAPRAGAPAASPAPPTVEERLADAGASIQHTTIFEPSQFDPAMRQVLDHLYRKARAQADEDGDRAQAEEDPEGGGNAEPG